MKINEILVILKVHPHKPIFFRIEETKEFFLLSINISSINKPNDWTTIDTARGAIKRYRSLDAVFTDLKKMCPDHDGNIIYRVVAENLQKIDHKPESIFYGRRVGDIKNWGNDNGI